ncbi:iron-siderophore ABC transporter substrate-binding protein [Nocardia sp. CNY236]|uniref:iron-siderophore ABC transporter substrate-binding protein n=1 Tax=Nocardia sp. CNY236 TaxID=1169152 RepID=UPI0009DD5624|nr:iron-siderophore ABC transporter substrate-binding protein [Nocardia sp. CNY236]
MPVSDAMQQRTRIRPIRRRLRALALGCAVLIAAGCATTEDDSASIVRTTTNIAGAGVVGLQRDTTRACPLPSAPDAADVATHSVTHDAGVTQVPADPQRIVALTTSALDAACALGLWERVVGAATVDGPSPYPAYLGNGVLRIPGIGPTTQPDPARIAELRPDLILGENSTGAANFTDLAAIAPTVLVGAPDWQSKFTTYAAGMGRSRAAEEALRNYRSEADETGITLAAEQTQASVIRFTAEDNRVQGSDSFSGHVLGDVGVQRPTAQRGTSFDVPVHEFATKAEGDVIYVVLAGPDGSLRGEAVMRTDEWQELGAAADHRVFVVDDTVWHGDGLTAARALLTDLRTTLNGYVTD